MSKRRQPGGVVRRTAFSGFLSDGSPPTGAPTVRVPASPDYEADVDPCMTCDDPDCREWANLEIVGGELAGRTLCHIAECQMEDAEAP